MGDPAAETVETLRQRVADLTAELAAAKEAGEPAAALRELRDAVAAVKTELATFKARPPTTSDAAPPKPASGKPGELPPPVDDWEALGR